MHKDRMIETLMHGCYRQSRRASAVTISMLAYHSRKQTWSDAVDLYIAMSDFSRQMFIQGGLPSSKIIVKPNFVHPDPGVQNGEGGYVVFVGRLSEEKGIHTLLRAWDSIEEPLSLKIVGDGPLAEYVQSAAAKDSRIEWLGRRPFEDTLSIIGHAACLVMPSIWYETFGRTIVEAFAKSTPVIVSNLGAMKELVEDGRTGLHVEAGDPRQLATAVRKLLTDKDRLGKMRIAARDAFEKQFTSQHNYQQLMVIYERALQGPPGRGV